MAFIEEPEEDRTEEVVDETLEASFPASDPPFWTLGCSDSADEPRPKQPAKPKAQAGSNRGASLPPAHREAQYKPASSGGGAARREIAAEAQDLRARARS